MRTKLILASGSPRRAKILSSLGVEFEIEKTDAREVSFPGDPERTVRENALAKGAAAGHAPGRRILSADTIVWHDGRIYGKPRSLEEAAGFLRRLSGRTHRVFTGVALDGDARIVCSEVRFRVLDEEKIARYVEAVKPLDRAGAYDIDESGDAIVEGWSGSYENIMGLPAAPLVDWGLVPGTRPVGFFDSGEGGRCVLEAFKNLCPAESTVYLADKANFPYGGKPREELLRISFANVRRLLDAGCKAVVVACNTATSAAIAQLRAEFPGVPFVGVEPALKPAAAVTKTGRIGVLATAGTLAGGKYLESKAKYAAGLTVFEEAAADWVELAERGETGGEKAERAVAARIGPLVAAGCDAIVLGCTHFTRLAALARKAAGAGVAVIDPAQAVARQIKRILEDNAAAAPAALPADAVRHRTI